VARVTKSGKGAHGLPRSLTLFPARSQRRYWACAFSRDRKPQEAEPDEDKQGLKDEAISVFVR